VLALFLCVAWFMRRGLPAGTALLPSEVVEVLGRAPLAGRQQMQLIRCGNKLLLVCLSVGCAETLTEITEPAEVDRLAGLCRESHPHSATAAFRHVFQQFGRERSGQGFLGSTADDRAAPTAAIVSKVGSRRLRQEDDDV
jgi:flagellar biogenesis protein FliO